MQVFLKRLTANELGETGANTRGEIYIPRSCVSFFPTPSGGRNPTSIVPFEWIEDDSIVGSTVRFTVYGNKNEAHLHKVPDAALGTAKSGDILRIDHNGDLFQSTIISGSSPLYDKAVKLLNQNAACITTQAKLDPPPPPPPPPPPKIETLHPLLEGPPSWASGWGEDEDFGPFVEIKVGMAKQRLRWIPNGSFLMGSPGKPETEGQTDEEPGRFAREGPQHVVTISDGFWMFDTPVTQDLYEAVTEDNPSRFKSPKRPVEQVSWNNAQRFLQKLNDQIPGLQASLPTEAQWEYACRAGTTDTLYSGSIEIIESDNAPALDPIAWYGGNCGGEFDLPDGEEITWSNKQFEFEKGGTREVGKKQANPWGLYDMLGNVYEWCDDGKREYSEAVAHDPRGPSEESADRVIRGGSWDSHARFVRAACRHWDSPEDRGHDLGFRCRVP